MAIGIAWPGVEGISEARQTTGPCAGGGGDRAEAGARHIDQVDVGAVAGVGLAAGSGRAIEVVEVEGMGVRGVGYNLGHGGVGPESQGQKQGKQR